MIAEGVHYSPFVARYVTTDGKRHQLTIWSPGPPWVREEVARALEGIDVRKGSNVVIRRRLRAAKS